MVAAAPLGRHPILGCVQACEEALEGVRDLQAVYLGPDEKEAALLALDRVLSRAAELRLRLIAAAADVADAHGARDVGSWLASATKEETRAPRAEEELAKALDSRYRQVAAGMADGIVSPAQARVIVEVLDDLPAEVGPDVIQQAEAHLVGWAADFRPGELRRLGRKILEVVAPEIAEEAEAKPLQAEEDRARETTGLSFRAQGDGTTRVSIRIPEAAAARLRTYLEAFTSPRHAEGTLLGEADRIPYRRRLGQAFCALLEHLDPHRLPDHGGDATTVMVTITLADLKKELATGLIDADPEAGDNLTAAQARRLACTAQIIPVVLGGTSEILDLGRSQRLFTPAQRKALRLRDKRCRAEGCDVPAPWTEAHHRDPWSHGGTTDLDHGVLLCNWHHHRVHDPRYHVDVLPNGDYRITRRR